MKKIAIVIILFIVYSKGYTQIPSLEMLSSALEKQVFNFPKTKVFIKTDKDIYASGEKIWFKAEAFNCLREKPARENKLIVLIKSESGEIIVDQKYDIENGQVSSFIILPSWVNEGNAYLIAYTPNVVKLDEASLAAIQPITINTLKRNDYIINAKLNKKIYHPGDEVKLNLTLNAITPSRKKEKVIVSLFDYQKKEFDEKLNITINEPTEFKFKLHQHVEDGFFLQIRSASKNNFSQKLPIRTTDDRIKLEFYPEGVSLLTNNTQRIVYRAMDPFGKPINITGSVYDAQNNRIGMGKMLKKGIGLISLMPMPNQTYTFIIESKYGKNQKFKMPHAILNGTAFTLSKTEESTFRVALHNTGTRVGEKLTIAVIDGGEIEMAFDVIAKQKNSFYLPTDSLPIGIINFAVLNTKGEIVSQRLLYNTPNRDSRIDIHTTFNTSHDNNEIDISINMNNFLEQFGQSQVDIRVVDVQNLYKSVEKQQHNFLKYPLITATPKTVLEIYMTNIELIANNYKHFSLQDILNGIDYSNEPHPKTFSGTVTDKDGNRIPNATVMAIHPNTPSLSTSISDQDGRFVFSNMVKTKNIILKAINESGKKTYQVHLDRTFDETLEELLLIESFNIKPIYSINTTSKYYELNADLLKLAGSETKNIKYKSMSTTENMLQSGASLLDAIRIIKPYTIDNNQIVFYGSNNSFYSQQGALIVIDGQKLGTSISSLNNINPYEVASINISTNPIDIQRYTALNSIGIIEIRTKGNEIDLKTKNETPKIVSASRFNASNVPKQVWKYQSTLYWEPNATINQNGMINLKLNKSAIKSDFKIEIDVTSPEGITHYQSTTFSTLSSEINW